VRESITQEHDAKEMSFLDHVEALRGHIFRAVLVIFGLSVLAFLFKDILFDDIIFGPLQPDFPTYRLMCWVSDKVPFLSNICPEAMEVNIINTEMAGQFIAHIKIAFLGGFILAFPYIFWEVWRFIKPGLYFNEVQYLRGIILYVWALFIAGCLFGYFLLAPFSISFLVNYAVSARVDNFFMLANYVGFITMFVIATGIIFELPVLVYFLSKMGFVTPDMMRTYRKHAYVGILFIAALITPSPDVGTQLVVTLPVILLYELSIGVSRRVNAQMARDLV
jgi:sec-independent protein translocase protein TatC